MAENDTHAAQAEPHFEYTPLRQGVQSIRLLHLEPGQPQSEIVCWLTNHVWSSETGRIEHDGGSLQGISGITSIYVILLLHIKY